MDKKVLSLLQGYLEKSRGKLQVAEKLLASGDYEDAVSRAYYAMYYAATAVLCLKGKTPKTHQGVKSLFGEYFVAQGEIDKSYALMLKVAKEMREDADYEIEVVITQDDAQESIEQAEKFVQKCKDTVGRYTS